ncbi:MAG: hypothetical protein GF398_03245 [Chitinivibrionales bacterium]|nr:hypothetical protein [Chitinivibrionales bacterium]
MPAAFRKVGLPPLWPCVRKKAGSNIRSTRGAPRITEKEKNYVVPMNRKVLHINIVNFYVAVARALEPKLRSYPVAVATTGANRRMIIDISVEARGAGIFRGMLLEKAKRTCPDLIVLTPTPELYDRAYGAVMQQAMQRSPRVEPAGPGHVFIDLSGTERLWGNAVDSADTLRKEIRNQFRLEATAGLAVNKLVSKVATRVIKPVGFCRILPGSEDEFLAPLPVTFLPGIDSKVLHKLVQFNIQIIKELHVFSPELLTNALGDYAFEIYQLAHGIDNTPVRVSKEPSPSVKESLVFAGQTNDMHEIWGRLFTLIARAGYQVRRLGLAAGKMLLRITYSDGDRSQRTTHLRTPLGGDLSLFEIAGHLLQKAYTRRIRLSSIEVELHDLLFPYGQLDLFFDNAKETGLMEALDSIRCHFGFGAIGFWGMQQGSAS